MYFIRPASVADVGALKILASHMVFINLPPDEVELKRKCELSERAFAGKVRRLGDAQYLFVLEDARTRKIIGTSNILAQHGTPREPHMYLEVGLRNHYSRTIGRGFVHEVLRLKFDTDGPTEIGGLVLDPTCRKSDHKLGRFLSFVRFMYMGMHPDRFRPKLLAELLPPFLPNGSSVLWESLGRKFTHMAYPDADRLSRRNKEFITSLFPKGEIFVGLLPTDVREVIGMVGPETEPVKHMLEKIGFRYTQMVDPFDGGPHFWADLADITIIKSMRELRAVPGDTSSPNSLWAMVGARKHGFCAVQTVCEMHGDRLKLPKDAMALLNVDDGDPVWMITYP
jgi:arginine N-succinyltransferase